MHRGKRKLALACAALTVAGATLLFAGRGAAQDAPPPGVVRAGGLQMAVRSGFGGLRVNQPFGTWAPFRIALSNQGEPLTGRLIVRTYGENGPTVQPREFVKDVQLPTGAEQLHEIVAYLNSDRDPEISLTVNGRVVAQTTLTIERNYYGSNEQMEIGVVDTDPTALNSLNAAEIPRTPSRQPFTSQPTKAPDPDASQTATMQSQQRRRSSVWFGVQQLSARPGVIAPEDLPRDFVAYDALDVLVLGDAPLSQLSEEQARALRLWVASGGLLVVTGAADFAGLHAAGLDTLLPVEPHGQTTRAALPELTSVYGPFESNDPLLLMAGGLKAGGRALLGPEALPVVAEKGFGSGLVRFVAFNPKLNPYRAWGAARELWTDVVLPAAQAPAGSVNWRMRAWGGSNSGNRPGIENYLFQLADIRPPSPSYFIFFLLAYIVVVGPVNYLVLRSARKLDWAWLTIPAVVLLFTVVSVAVARFSRGDSIAVDVSLVELHQPESVSRAMSGMMVMPSSKAVYEMRFEGRQSYINDVLDGPSSSSATVEPLEYGRENGRLELRAPMITWTPGAFQVRSVEEDHTPLVAVTKNGNTVTVRNLSDGAISKAVYLGPDGVSGLFDLAAGGERQVSLSAPPAAVLSTWYADALGESTDEQKIFFSLAPMLDRPSGSGRALPAGFVESETLPAAIQKLERPILIGFVERSPVNVEFSRSLSRRSRAFYIIYL